MRRLLIGSEYLALPVSYGHAGTEFQETGVGADLFSDAGGLPTCVSHPEAGGYTGSEVS
jgi:hypothetical protein